MRVFLTGASGFIGSHVARALLDRGHDLALLIMPNDSMWRLRNIDQQPDIIYGTLADADLLETFFQSYRPEACIHLAWYTEPGQYLDSEKNISSLADSLTLYKKLIAAGCRQIITAGTCFEYDTRHGYLCEETPVEPLSLYAAAKLSCLFLGSRLAMQSNVMFAWGRIFYPYGPMEDERRLVQAAIKSIIQGQSFPASTGEQIRDYIHVTDVASAFCTIIEKQASGIFNIATGIPVSVRQILESIEHLMNHPDLIQLGALPSRNWEPPFICGNNTRLRTLGWRPSFSLTDGLADTIRFLKAESNRI